MIRCRQKSKIKSHGHNMVKYSTKYCLESHDWNCTIQRKFLGGQCVALAYWVNLQAEEFHQRSSLARLDALIDRLMNDWRLINWLFGWLIDWHCYIKRVKLFNVHFTFHFKCTLSMSQGPCHWSVSYTFPCVFVPHRGWQRLWCATDHRSGCGKGRPSPTDGGPHLLLLQVSYLLIMQVSVASLTCCLSACLCLCEGRGERGAVDF